MPTKKKKLSGEELIKNSMTLEEMQKKWDAERKWEKAHPVQTAFKNAYWFLRYGIARHLSDAKYSVKWGFQRMFRGYDDPMVWNYWSEIARLNIKLLKNLKRIKHGYPVILLNKKEEKEWKLRWGKDDAKLDKKYAERWDDYMTKMIAGWQAILDEDDVHLKTNGKYDHTKSEAKRKKLLAIFKEGMTLYTEHYRGLWD